MVMSLEPAARDMPWHLLCSSRKLDPLLGGFLNDQLLPQATSVLCGVVVVNPVALSLGLVFSSMNMDSAGCVMIRSRGLPISWVSISDLPCSMQGWATMTPALSKLAFQQVSLKGTHLWVSILCQPHNVHLYPKMACPTLPMYCNVSF